jgi:hypothetical protein
MYIFWHFLDDDNDNDMAFPRRVRCPVSILVCGANLTCADAAVAAVAVAAAVGEMAEQWRTFTNPRSDDDDATIGLMVKSINIQTIIVDCFIAIPCVPLLVEEDR